MEEFLSENLKNIIDKYEEDYHYWSFDHALGNTIAEKYESLYIVCVKATYELVRKGVNGRFWICTSPEIAALFECSCAFEPCLHGSKAQELTGKNKTSYKGIANRKWDLFTNIDMPQDTLIIGAESCDNHNKIRVVNF